MSFSVSTAAPHELMPALRVLFGRRASPERDRRIEHCRDAIASGKHDPTGLFVTRDSASHITGAAMAQAMPGALGVMWAPHGESPRSENALVKAACDWLRGRGVKVCQSFATVAELPEMAALQRTGFRHATQLVSMRRVVDAERDKLASENQLDGMLYHPDFREQFTNTLLATHKKTLDCPELNAIRTPEEIVASFTLPEGVSPWLFLARLDGEAVGISQLEPGEGILTLMYLGVVPAARGRGIGAALLRQVLGDAAGNKFAAVELSVDGRNEPALRLYRRNGFVETARSEVFIAQWG
jgi:ribosomal protein S18 acetylase RimI-like enzyme